MLEPPESTARDAHAHLLRDTRGLRREHSSAREAWLSALEIEGAPRLLFELEMLLKAIACFGNARNHTGPARRAPAVTHDFVEELRVLRATLDRAVELARALLGPRDRLHAFSRYLESLLPEDSARHRLVREQLAQNTPEEALLALRSAMASGLEIVDGVLRSGRISHRLWFALHGTFVREIARNAFFNPLVALEFRPEFDRIDDATWLDALARIESDTAHRVAVLVVLTLRRATRYLELVDVHADDPTRWRLALAMLAVLRSDSRALVRFLERRAGDVLADGLERELLALSAFDVRARFSELERAARRVLGLRRTLQTLAARLRVEVRFVLEHELPPPDEAARVPMGPLLRVASDRLRAALAEASESLAAALGVRSPVSTPSAADRGSQADRWTSLWMLAQVVRAFLAKARVAREHAGDAVEAWRGRDGPQFVRDFARHLRVLSTPWPVAADGRLAAMWAALDEARAADHLDEARLARLLSTTEAFARHLETLLASLEREGGAFDRAAAARRLRLYLAAP
ncbi:MAG: hypothetical protein NZ898_14550 [Myxococcota bacterium]|nr:hypothetical protein [Myxococcota bacterium]MDW8363009.1 hypothetical protein [Myxococcales bacterium]